MNKRIAYEDGTLIVELGATRLTLPSGARPHVRLPHVAAQYLDAEEREAFALLADVFDCQEVVFKETGRGD